MDGREEIRAFLSALAAYREGNGDKCVESVLLEKGVWFEGRRRSDDYPTAKAWKPKVEPQHCYANSQHYCVSDKAARYFEGYALVPGLRPIEHAWIVMPDGVVDFTLELMEVEAASQGVPCDTSKTVYLGMEVPIKFTILTVLKAGETQPLLELYFNNQAT